MSVTRDEIDKILNYDPVTGIFTYKVSTNNRVKVGDVAGSPCLGYLTIMYKRRNWRLHRLVFLLEDGEFPPEQVDHINGIRDDNRRFNLRKVTNQQNSWNKYSTGASLLTSAKKYMSYVYLNGKQIYLGYYDTKDQAMLVSRTKNKELKGEYVREVVL